MPLEPEAARKDPRGLQGSVALLTRVDFGELGDDTLCLLVLQSPRSLLTAAAGNESSTRQVISYQSKRRKL